MDSKIDWRRRVLEAVKRGYKKQVKIRRDFHMNPELSFQEFKTTQYIKILLSRSGFKSHPIKLKTGFVTDLTGRKKGKGKGKSKTIAIRSDIDALPVTELTGLSYKSRYKGCMHACGHDMHMATVLGAALILK